MDLLTVLLIAAGYLLGVTTGLLLIAFHELGHREPPAPSPSPDRPGRTWDDIDLEYRHLISDETGL